MGRLIDADKLMEAIKAHHYPLVVKGLNSTDYGMFTLGIQQVVDEQPPVDAVEVVRCKDCQYFGRLDHEIYCYMLGANKRLRFSFSEDGYCSWGERRKEV